MSKDDPEIGVCQSCGLPPDLCVCKEIEKQVKKTNLFKSKEELIKEIEYSKDSDRGIALECGIERAFQSIAERKKFYEEHIIEDTPDEYFGSLKMMEKRCPELYKEFKKQFKLSWNDWLFHKCFDGVK